MSLDDRCDLFGNPTETGAAEAVYSFRQRDPDNEWPFWDEAVERLSEATECDEEDAEERIAQAIKADEVHPHLFDVAGSEPEWGLRIDEEMAARSNGEPWSSASNATTRR